MDKVYLASGIKDTSAARPQVSLMPATDPEAIGYKRPDRDGRAPVPFWTTAQARRQLRIMAAEEGTTQQKLMAEALNLLFTGHGKPPLA
jgi:hypothetical protein